MKEKEKDIIKQIKEICEITNFSNTIKIFMIAEIILKNEEIIRKNIKGGKTK